MSNWSPGPSTNKSVGGWSRSGFKLLDMKTALVRAGAWASADFGAAVAINEAGGTGAKTGSEARILAARTGAGAAAGAGAGAGVASALKPPELRGSPSNFACSVAQPARRTTLRPTQYGRFSFFILVDDRVD